MKYIMNFSRFYLLVMKKCTFLKNIFVSVNEIADSYEMSQLFNQIERMVAKLV